jgi:flagellar L-ring protein precursor FlgH
MIKLAVMLTLSMLVSVTGVAQDGSLLRQGSPRFVDAPVNAGVISGQGPSGNLAQRADSSSNNGPAGTLPLKPYDARVNQEAGVPLSGVSWTYEPPARSRVYQRYDIVTIRVDEISRALAEGNIEARRNTLYDALLKDWIKLEGLSKVRPAQQEDGDPRVQGSTNQLYRADASMETRESLSFNIAARIVDIRPNGDLVLEARKSIRINDNVFETALTGICRPTDIAADNVVLSRDLLDLQITKMDQGRLRDNYARGWFTRWFDTLNPF